MADDLGPMPSPSGLAQRLIRLSVCAISRAAWSFASCHLLVEGNTMPGAVALASRALAICYAEQAASQSNAADRTLEMRGWPITIIPRWSDYQANW